MTYRRQTEEEKFAEYLDANSSYCRLERRDLLERLAREALYGDMRHAAHIVPLYCIGATIE